MIKGREDSGRIQFTPKWEGKGGERGTGGGAQKIEDVLG
jgi:hypothetical protein